MGVFRQDHATHLKAYVRRDQPFGPPDAADIKEPVCSAALFDWHNMAFAELLTGSDVLIGRRGSGKSALLSTFRGKRFMRDELSTEEARDYRDRHNLSAKTFLAVPDLVVEIDTPQLIDHFEQYCRNRGSAPPVELMARQWNARLWLEVGRAIHEHYTYLWDTLPQAVRDYVGSDDVVRQAMDGGGQRIMSADQYVDELRRSLEQQRKRCVLTLDNIERYTFEPVQNAVMTGLIAATGKMISRQDPVLDVKLCLPAEVFERLKELCFRSDKDLQKLQYLHWNSAELMHVAATRLKVYFQLYDEESFDTIKDLRLSERSALRSFWKRFLPERVTNSIRVEEETFTYLLRHTQMLPRHLLTVLNAIASRIPRDGRALFRVPVSADDIVKGVEDTEDANAQAVLSMFEPTYPFVREVFDLVMPRLTRVFDYGYLHSVYNSSAKQPMENMKRGDFRQFWRLMLSTGAIGVVENDSSSDVYEEARFEFNSKHTLKISDKDRLCVHPIFSRIYNVDQGGSSKVVLPRGSEFGLEERALA
jgi:hypothetical protein